MEINEGLFLFKRGLTPSEWDEDPDVFRTGFSKASLQFQFFYFFWGGRDVYFLGVFAFVSSFQHYSICSILVKNSVKMIWLVCFYMIFCGTFFFLHTHLCLVPFQM